MNFVTLLEQGNGWLFIPSAILLGALHGLAVIPHPVLDLRIA